MTKSVYVNCYTAFIKQKEVIRMMDFEYFLFFLILSIVLPQIVFPLIVLCAAKMILIIGKVIEYTEHRKNDFRYLLITRCFYYLLYFFAWGVMLIGYVILSVFEAIEIWGGFLDEDVPDEA